MRVGFLISIIVMTSCNIAKAALQKVWSCILIMHAATCEQPIKLKCWMQFLDSILTWSNHACLEVTCLSWNLKGASNTANMIDVILSIAWFIISTNLHNDFNSTKLEVSPSSPSTTSPLKPWSHPYLSSWLAIPIQKHGLSTESLW